MTISTDNTYNKKFSVVQFLEIPYEGIDDYVCVPVNWVVFRRKQDQKVVVAYPKDEDRYVTRDRVKREETYNKEWESWTAELKYQSDTFEDADFWIATRNDYGPLILQNSSLNDTPSTSTLNKKLRCSKRIAKQKRPASDESQSQLETKRVKNSTAKAAEPTGAVSHSANEEPSSSTPETIKDGPLVSESDEDEHSQLDQQFSENNDNNANQLVKNTTPAQNNLQDNGNSNFQPQITSVQSLATTSNNHVSHAGDFSNNGPSTSAYSQLEPESIATQLYKKMKGRPSLVAKHPAVEKKMRFENITRNVAILLNTPSNKKMKGTPSLVAEHPAVEKKMRLEAITRNVAYLLNISSNTMSQNQPCRPATQEAIRRSPSLLFSNLPVSIQRELFFTHSEYLSPEEKLQVYFRNDIHNSSPPSPTELRYLTADSASEASTSRNVAQEVPLIAEERDNAANFNGDQERNDVVNEARERNPSRKSRLTLPPEYDPDDTRWTLKHYEHRPGLIELKPHSNIYVNYGELKFCEETSTNCPMLARRILLEVFSKKALIVCSSMTEKGHDYSIYPDERPKLDEHACVVLLTYILKHGRERNWNTDMQPILKGLHDKVREIRFRQWF